MNRAVLRSSHLDDRERLRPRRDLTHQALEAFAGADVVAEEAIW